MPGAFTSLARAYAHNKQCTPYDHGYCYDPMGKLTPTTYQSTAIITAAVKSIAAVEGGRQCTITLAHAPRDQDPQVGDTIYISGTSSFNGEHVLTSIVTNSSWVFTDYANAANPGGTEITENEGWLYYAPTAKGVILVDPARVLSHPGFRQFEGEGIYTYPFNPTITRNFIYHPARKVDGLVQRTLSSNVFIARPQVDEDIVITEIWLGGNRTLSTLAEMFQVFYSYWTTIPEVGEALGWEPRDKTSDRFLVNIVRVQLGGIDFEYNEVRQTFNENRNAYLDRQLTLQLKLVKKTKAPIPQITLEGL